MKVYFISGLAADGRVFRHIQLPADYEAVYLNWLRPDKDESLTNYAGRMSGQIDTTEPFYILGLSLGGMIAAEIVRLYPQGRLILVASIPHAGHLPVYYRWMQRVRLQKLVPVRAIKTGVYLRRYFTTESKEDKEMLRQMIRDADPYFIRWSLTAVLEWQRYEPPQDLIHIHGTNDIVLPVRYTRPTHIIPGGSHLMIFDRARDINEVLSEILS
ncbi:MAG: alpha/beta hydrolase [Chitinophagaceae bacterium]|nr:alpha/beta hydrolase [Chitinophagaceae bacterium]